MSSCPTDWHAELESVLRGTEAEVMKALTRIKSYFDKSGMQFDQHFRTTFLSILQNRMTETYDKFQLTALANLIKPENRLTNPFLSDIDENETTSNGKDDTDDGVGSVVSLDQMKRINELNEQKKLYKEIVILGIPENSDKNLKQIFAKICHILNADTTMNGIQIRRAPSSRIIVQFVSFPEKTRFLRAYRLHTSRLTLGDILETESIESQNHIFIDSHLTKWYFNMMLHAKEAKKDGLLCGYWITSAGLAVSKERNSIPEHCLSIEDIDNIIYDS